MTSHELANCAGTAAAASTTKSSSRRDTLKHGSISTAQGSSECDSRNSQRCASTPAHSFTLLPAKAARHMRIALFTADAGRSQVHITETKYNLTKISSACVCLPQRERERETETETETETESDREKRETNTSTHINTHQHTHTHELHERIKATRWPKMVRVWFSKRRPTTATSTATSTSCPRAMRAPEWGHGIEAGTRGYRPWWERVRAASTPATLQQRVVWAHVHATSRRWWSTCPPQPQVHEFDGREWAVKGDTKERDRDRQRQTETDTHTHTHTHRHT